MLVGDSHVSFSEYREEHMAARSLLLCNFLAPGWVAPCLTARHFAGVGRDLGGGPQCLEIIAQ